MRRVKGTNDYFGEEQEKRALVIDIIRDVFIRHGYTEVVTPAFEYTDTLEQKDALGDTNIKDVFRIASKSGKGDEIGMRFDMTTPIARLLNEHKRLPKPIKWFYIAPVWRKETPQKGRYIEFWQFGIENIGSKNKALSDTENLIVFDEILKEVGVKDYQFVVNSREKIREMMFRHNSTINFSKLCRVLDKRDKLTSKELDKEMQKEVGMTLKEFEDLDASSGDVDINLLDNSSVKTKQDLTLVRGLDYYTGFIFEVEVKGMPWSIGGGGRYDNLLKKMGAEDLPATGFSGSIERLMLSMGDEKLKEMLSKQKREKVLFVGGNDEVINLIKSFSYWYKNKKIIKEVFDKGDDKKKSIEYARRFDFDLVVNWAKKDSIFSIINIKTKAEKECKIDIETKEEINKIINE